MVADDICQLLAFESMKREISYHGILLIFATSPPNIWGLIGLEFGPWEICFSDGNFIADESCIMVPHLQSTEVKRKLKIDFGAYFEKLIFIPCWVVSTKVTAIKNRKWSYPKIVKN